MDKQINSLRPGGETVLSHFGGVSVHAERSGDGSRLTIYRKIVQAGASTIIVIKRCAF